MTEIQLDDTVYDHVDPRHIGTVCKIVNNIALVHWDDTGWFTLIQLKHLRKVRWKND